MNNWLKLVIFLGGVWALVLFMKKNEQPTPSAQVVSSQAPQAGTSRNATVLQEQPNHYASQEEALIAQGYVYADETKADPNCQEDPLGQFKVKITEPVEDKNSRLTGSDVRVAGYVDNAEDSAVLEVCIRLGKYKKCQILTVPAGYHNAWSVIFPLPRDVEGYLYFTVKANSRNLCAIDLVSG
jgi:hypothetical protein